MQLLLLTLLDATDQYESMNIKYLRYSAKSCHGVVVIHDV